MSASDDTMAVAMSGGVDSSVTAALMLEAGHRVIGVTMQTADEAVPPAAAAEVARFLGVPHHVIDLRDAFRELVLHPCWEEYARGRTPNPCVVCNPRVKFGLLLEAARGLGATALATGHHARLVEGPEAPIVARGRDRSKDQSYFLARLTADQRRAARFPIGEMTKSEVRALARSRGLPSAETPDSQDSCVVLDEGVGREGAFAETLRRRLGARAEEGELVDLGGRPLGRHQGLHLFTVGQRRGLGVSLGRRAYVVRLDGERREVVISADPTDLEARSLRADDVIWSVTPALDGDGQAALACQVQIRSRHLAEAATVLWQGGRTAEVHFDEPVAAITPGQAAVFYRDDLVLGAGRIR